MITKLDDTQMQIGIDSFAAAYDDASLAVSPSDRLRNLVEEIEYADQVGKEIDTDYCARGVRYRAFETAQSGAPFKNVSACGAVVETGRNSQLDVVSGASSKSSSGTARLRLTKI